jgi:hypothetical protein
MALQVFVFVFLLVVCLFLSLVLLWRLDWFHRRPSSSRGGVKRTAVQRLLKPHSPEIAPPVVSTPLPRRVESLHLGLCVPGARLKAAGEHPNRYTPTDFLLSLH